MGRVIAKVFVASWLCVALLPPGAPAAQEAEDEEIKVFDADLGPASIDVGGYPPEYQALYPLFAQKCSKCHTLARPINSSKQGDEWLAYVSRMSRKPGSGVNPNDAERIYDFLAYDSRVRARSATAVDPELLPFIEVSNELCGVKRFVAANQNVPVETAELRVRVQGDRRLDLRRFFASDAGQKLVHWSQRDPGRGELVLLAVETLDGGSPEPAGRPASDGPVGNAAAEAVGTEQDPRERIELILDWLDESIVRTYRPGDARPEETLAAREGDATEFTRLFCEMARAAGIPARTRVGFAARRTAFHCHTWAEVWLDGWVPVDPYLGQLPADITHIRLQSPGGDELTDWDPGRYPALERLKLEAVIADEGAEGDPSGE